ncbi:hypothetical protein [Chryseobacterium sp.]|uniref:hypothetical protein n=1 Tax=Chryseobacterium sp. TaxID=1871047 RepID=UPI0011C9A1AE|nr:hypothetical protein [Chryseobacterium sp.]TXF79605.1 hypothetical protein FUA25_04270 [Chryseobacterium sp.]
MKNLLIVLVIFLGCSKKETENINVDQITVRYLGSQDAPHPIIILTNRKPNENDFPTVNYQVEKEDLIKIEKISYSKIRDYNRESLVLVKINKDNRIEKYFFKKKNGIEILSQIQKILSHYNNEQLNNDLFDLQLATKQNWYRDGRIIGL